MNRNSGLALNTRWMHSSLSRVIEVLVHAAVLDQHHVAGLPGDLAAVMNVIAVALEHIEHRAVEVAVLLAAGLGSVGLDVGLDGLDDRGRLRADHALAEHLRPALPGHVLRGVDPLFLFQRLVEVAVGALQRSHEGPFLGPALPLLVLLLHFHRVGLVMPHARSLDHVGHALLLQLLSRPQGGEILAGHRRLPRCAQSSRPAEATSADHAAR